MYDDYFIKVFPMFDAHYYMRLWMAEPAIIIYCFFQQLSIPFIEHRIKAFRQSILFNRVWTDGFQRLLNPAQLTRFLRAQYRHTIYTVTHDAGGIHLFCIVQSIIHNIHLLILAGSAPCALLCAR